MASPCLVLLGKCGWFLPTNFLPSELHEFSKRRPRETLANQACDDSEHFVSVADSAVTLCISLFNAQTGHAGKGTKNLPRQPAAANGSDEAVAGHSSDTAAPTDATPPSACVL